MRYLRRSPSPGESSRTENTHLDSVMADDGPSAAVQPLLRAIAGDPRPHELAGFDGPLADFRAAFPMSVPSVRKTWRNAMLSPLGASIAGLALALGGTSAAAFSGALPAPAQDFAHRVIGAPAATATQLRIHTATHTDDPSSAGTPGSAGTPVGPDASGPAAFGLCTAWTAHQSNPASTTGKADDSVAFRNLATAAGGVDKIAAYCATILHSSSPTVAGAPTTEQTQASTDHSMGRPTSLPTQASTGRPGTMPTQASAHHAIGKPTTLPARG